jgi:Na+-driven multidrug efflux pump
MEKKSKIKRFWLNLLFMMMSIVIMLIFSQWIEKIYSESPEEYVPEIGNELLKILYITALITISFVISSSKATIKSKFILLFILNCISLLYILEFWPNIKEIILFGLKFNS